MFGLKLLDEDVGERPALVLFNTEGAKKEAFAPLKRRAVTMYSCGPTVYDYAHIGNLRAYVFADVLRRTLRYNGYKVNHTINLTDFGHLTSDADSGEDKMMKAIRRAEKEPTLETMREVAEPFIDAFKEDLGALNILPPTQLTRASDFVREQIALIKTLVDKGYTYETSDGVYFDISRFPRYGALGDIDVAKLKEGARVEENPEKRHPADFALWKKGELGWESEWGKGFPGWHIECTAMAFATLGKQIDIHTGGEDLKYTHHNGEIAQAECATGKHYVRYWMHSAFITLHDQKISKSLSNTIGLRQLKEKGYAGDVYRYWLLTGHYRSQMNFTFEALGGAKQALYRLKRTLFEEYKNASGKVNGAYRQKFLEAINDDLDTPRAIALLWDVAKDAELAPGEKVATLREMDKVLGIGLRDEPADARRELGVISAGDIPHEVQERINAREVARTEKDWPKADRLRDEITDLGYTLEDTPEGPRVTKTEM